MKTINREPSMVNMENDINSIKAWMLLHRYAFSCERVLGIVCRALKVSEAQLRNKCKFEAITDARKVYWWFAAELCSGSPTEIAEMVGKTHGNVRHSLNWVNDKIEVYDEKTHAAITAVYNQFLIER